MCAASAVGICFNENNIPTNEKAAGGDPIDGLNFQPVDTATRWTGRRADSYICQMKRAAFIKNNDLPSVWENAIYDLAELKSQGRWWIVNIGNSVPPFRIFFFQYYS